jgi:flagella basal body P-ring formation protein FlgA
MMRCGLLWLLVLAPAWSSAAEVRLKAEAVVAGPYFTLGDIAAVDGEALRGLRIGLSPRAAGALTLQSDDVQRVLLRLRPELRGGLEVQGSKTTVVRRGPLQTMDFARVQEAAHDALRAALAERYVRFESKSLAEAARAVTLPAGNPGLSARLPALVPAPRKATVWVDIHVDGRLYQAVPVAFELRAYAPALVARRALRPGEQPGPGDFDRGEPDVAGHGVPVAELGSMRLTRPLAAGSILTAGHVESAPAVARNQEVRVRLAVGAVAVETTAIAARDAAAGEVIRVRNAASNQTFSARVTGSGVVEALWR